MAILQALFAFISKSAGKVLNAIFGWAVRALFGQTTAREQTFLSLLVFAAVAWPLLVVGVAAPRIASLLLAFVPLSKSIPAWIIRVVWLALAVVVPLAVGLAVAARAPAHMPRQSFVRRMLRGFPITIGLAAAFLIMFVSVPLMRLAAIARGQRSATIPLVTDAAGYHRVAARLVKVLNAHQFGMHPARPGWWVSAPTRILFWFGGDAFRSYVPAKLEHHVSRDLELSMYPSGVMLRGRPARLTRAQGLLAEAITGTDGVQTNAPEAQALEHEIRQVWRVYEQEPRAHAGSARLLGRVDEIARDLGALDLEFDDWQVLYRQVLQLERAVRGEPQLMEAKPSGEEGQMADEREQDREKQGRAAEPVPEPRVAATLSTGELVKEITHEVGMLARKQIELAKTELRADLKAEVAMASGLGIAAIAALLGSSLLFVTIALALSLVMPAWAAGLIVTGFLLAVAAIAALVGWGKRVRSPLARTRRTLQDDVHWTKERLA